MEQTSENTSGADSGSRRKEIDRFLDDFNCSRSQIESFEKEKIPISEVFENRERLAVTVELPEINVNDVRVSPTGNMLTLRGKKRKEKWDANGHPYQGERTDEVFQHTFRIPAGADPDCIKVKFSDNVLRIIVPKSTGAGNEKMDINSA